MFLSPLFEYCGLHRLWLARSIHRFVSLRWLIASTLDGETRMCPYRSVKGARIPHVLEIKGPQDNSLKHIFEARRFLLLLHSPAINSTTWRRDRPLCTPIPSFSFQLQPHCWAESQPFRVCTTSGHTKPPKSLTMATATSAAPNPVTSVRGHHIACQWR